jgi:hypothetical protein
MDDVLRLLSVEMGCVTEVIRQLAPDAVIVYVLYVSWRTTGVLSDCPGLQGPGNRVCRRRMEL